LSWGKTVTLLEKSNSLIQPKRERLKMTITKMSQLANQARAILDDTAKTSDYDKSVASLVKITIYAEYRQLDTLIQNMEKEAAAYRQASRNLLKVIGEYRANGWDASPLRLEYKNVHRKSAEIEDMLDGLYRTKNRVNIFDLN
jgi:vacuolar-type H+-ATPase subunit D/Vma8